MLLLFTIVPPIASGSYISAMPQVMESFAESPGRVQLALTSNLLGMALGQLAVGPIADRTGRRRPLVVSLAVSVLATLACAVASDLPTLAAARFLQGVSGAMGMILASVIATDALVGRRLLSAFSMMAMVGTVGPIVAPVVGTWWLRFGDWRGMFVFCAVLSVVCLVASLGLVPETLARGSRVNGGLRTLLSAFGSILRRPLFLGYGASRGLAYAVVVAFTASSPFVLRDSLRMTEQEHLVVYSTGALGLCVVVLLAPAITVRIGAQTTLLCGFVSSGVGSSLVVLSALTDGPAAVTVAGMVVAPWCLGLIIGTSSGLAMEQVRDFAGTGSSVVGGTMFGVGALISMLVALGDPGNILSIGLIMLLCGVAGVGVTAGLRTRPRT